jgi:hypothetical protein
VKRSLVALAILISLALFAAAAAAKKESGTTVDSGSFEVLVDGKRVGTEHFKIQQNAAGSVTTSTIKVVAGTKAEQSSTLQLNATGELVHYDWKELSPGKAQTTVEVSGGILLQKVTLVAGKKPDELPYMTPPSTFILDDNFFTHRQLIVWRYLGGNCGTKDGKFACVPGKLGILVPAQHIKAIVALELVGLEKISWKGSEREVLHVKLTADEIAWDIWVDPADSYKVLRILIPANKTEVLRT